MSSIIIGGGGVYGVNKLGASLLWNINVLWCGAAFDLVYSISSVRKTQCLSNAFGRVAEWTEGDAENLIWAFLQLKQDAAKDVKLNVSVAYRNMVRLNSPFTICVTLSLIDDSNYKHSFDFIKISISLSKSKITAIIWTNDV